MAKEYYRNIYITGIIVLLVLMSLVVVLFYQIFPTLLRRDIPVLAPWIYLLVMALLITSTVLYARQADRIRVSIYENSIETLYRNAYWANLRIVWIVVIAGGVFFAGIVPKFFQQGMPRFLILLQSSVYIVVIALLFATVILYAREEERVTRAAFINFARKLGVDETTLQQFRQPVYGNQKISGVWAEVRVNYKDCQFTLSAENVLGSAKRGCFRYFLISANKKRPEIKGDLSGLLNSQARGLFDEMSKELERSWIYKEHKVQLLTSDGKLSCRVPLTPKATANHIHTAMDILLSIK